MVKQESWIYNRNPGSIRRRAEEGQAMASLSQELKYGDWQNQHYFFNPLSHQVRLLPYSHLQLLPGQVYLRSPWLD